MFRFLSAKKRPVSPARASFRPQLEDLEGRALPSGLGPVVQFVPAIISNQAVIADNVRLDGGNLKQDLEKAIQPVTLEHKPTEPTEPVKGGPGHVTPFAQVRTDHLLNPGIEAIVALVNAGQNGGGGGGSW
jgi:hypothetical protein